MACEGWMAGAAALQAENSQLRDIIAERDDLIIQLRADVLTLGSAVKNVNVEAGGNTTTNRILSPGGGSAPDPFAAPGDGGDGGGVPTWAKLLGVTLLGLAIYKLNTR